MICRHLATMTAPHSHRPVAAAAPETICCATCMILTLLLASEKKKKDIRHLSDWIVWDLEDAAAQHARNMIFLFSYPSASRFLSCKLYLRMGRARSQWATLTFDTALAFGALPPWSSPPRPTLEENLRRRSCLVVLEHGMAWNGMGTAAGAVRWGTRASEHTS